MRSSVDFSTASKTSYKDFRKKHKTLKITREQWRNILYTYSEYFKEYLLETGEKAKLPYGLGEFAINKKKKKRVKVVEGREYNNMAIDWPKTLAKGKRIYNFNYHTEGYSFAWIIIKKTPSFKMSGLWYFKASRVTSRLLAHYLKTDNKYQHLYKEWQK